MEFRRHPGDTEGRHPGCPSHQLFQHLIKSQENIFGRGGGCSPPSGDSDRGVGLASTEREGYDMEAESRRLLIELANGGTLLCPQSMVQRISRHDRDGRSWVVTHDHQKHEVSDQEAGRLMELLFES